MQKIIIGIIGVLLVIGIFALAPSPEPQTPGTNEASHTVQSAPMNEDMQEMDVSGIHIMADGTVMDGNGAPIADAMIQADGTVLLRDGRIVTPLVDFRN